MYCPLKTQENLYISSQVTKIFMKLAAYEESYIHPSKYNFLSNK